MDDDDNDGDEGHLTASVTSSSTRCTHGFNGYGLESRSVATGSFLPKTTATTTGDG